MKVLSTESEQVLSKDFVDYIARTMREQSMFILPRFYLGSEMNNYDVWKLAAWFDPTNETTQLLENYVEGVRNVPNMRQFPRCAELVAVCGGRRHSGKRWLNGNFLDPVSIRLHHCIAGSGSVTNTSTKQTLAFKPGDVMVFTEDDAKAELQLDFTTDWVCHLVSVWTPPTAKSNWSLFAEFHSKSKSDIAQVAFTNI